MKHILFYGIIIFALSCSNNSATKAAEDSASKQVDTTQEVKPAKTTSQATSNQAPLPLSYVYVNAPNGLTCREAPDIKAEKIGKFDLGARLGLLEKTNIPFQVVDQGELLKGEWIKVRFADYTWQDPYKPLSGYVFSGFTVDSLEADHLKLPQYFGSDITLVDFIEPQKLELSFKPIDAKTFDNLPAFDNDIIIPDTTKAIEEFKGGSFIVETDKSNLKFPCGPHFRRPCYVYQGFLPAINCFLIGQFGEAVYSSFLLDKNNEAVFHLLAEQDGGAPPPSISPNNKYMATFESIDAYDAEQYYESRTIITLYDIQGLKNLSDIQATYSYANKEWEIWDYKWIDDESFALKIFEEGRQDQNGMRIPVKCSYLKATIVE